MSTHKPNINFEILSKVFLISAFLTLLLIPIDALAIYLTEPAISETSSDYSKKFHYSFENPKISSGRIIVEALSRSSAFGQAAEKKEPAAVAIDPLRGIDVKGIVSIGDSNIIIRHAESGKVAFLKKGDKVNGLKVETINSDHVIFVDSAGKKYNKYLEEGQ